MTREVQGTALAALVALLLLAVSLPATAAGAARAPASHRVLDDVFEARSFWGAHLRNTPHRGWTTDVRTIANIREGFRTERGKRVAFRTVCLDIEQYVTDPRGNQVLDPSGLAPYDNGCADVGAGAGDVAQDLSTATISLPRLQLTHFTWHCPTPGEIDGCFTESTPGRVVDFQATWTPISPVDVFSWGCSRGRRSHEWLRLADAEGTVDGVSVGEAASGDEGVRIARSVRTRGCSH